MADTLLRSVTDVVADFFGTAPDLQQIAECCLPSELQDRAHLLLEKNLKGALTAQERTESEEFRQIEHFLTLIKTKARLKLKAQSTGE